MEEKYFCVEGWTGQIRLRLLRKSRIWREELELFQPVGANSNLAFKAPSLKGGMVFLGSSLVTPYATRLLN